MNDYLKKIISDALQKLYPDLELPEIILEKPRIAEHGDMATNVAMTLAKPLRKAPRGIAEELVGALEYDAGQLESVEIAGPGFINFRFAASWLYDALNGALQQGSGFGKSTLLKGKRYQVEFVSATPPDHLPWVMVGMPFWAIPLPGCMSGPGLRWSASIISITPAGRCGCSETAWRCAISSCSVVIWSFPRAATRENTSWILPGK